MLGGKPLTRGLVALGNLHGGGLRGPLPPPPGGRACPRSNGFFVRVCAGLWVSKNARKQLKCCDATGLRMQFCRVGSASLMLLRRREARNRAPSRSRAEKTLSGYLLAAQRLPWSACLARWIFLEIGMEFRRREALAGKCLPPARPVGTSRLVPNAP